jgi:hypothetical protein
MLELPCGRSPSGGPACLTQNNLQPRLWANLRRGFFEPSFGRAWSGTGCGIVGADARPNWTERPSLTGTQWRLESKA